MGPWELADALELALELRHGAAFGGAVGDAKERLDRPGFAGIRNGLNTYAYDVRGRMVQATSSIGATTYQVNALGQRVRKTNSLGDRVFHYDTKGRLIAESDAAGSMKREILYLGDIPVGVVQ